MIDGALTISQVTMHIKQLVNRDELLQELLVRGEIANFTRHSSGHLYFTLRDADAQLSCVCFRGSAATLGFKPEDGMSVLAGGNITVYERAGRYQLVVRFLRPDGQGSLQAKLEALRARLEAEGLFEVSRKRLLPRFPRCIALCTSATGAAIHDLNTIIARRYPLARMILFPTLVQGPDAGASIAASLRAADAHPDVDVIIVGRGGGSSEDLWAFNEETVARAVFACRRPTISAVGHETDFTLCDMVADVCAPTPSAAAELAVPDMQELLAGLRQQGQRLRGGLLQAAQNARRGLGRLESRAPLRQPQRLLDPWAQRLDDAEQARCRATADTVEKLRVRAERAGEKLTALGPQGVLGRGYAIVQRADDRTVVRSPAQTPVGAVLVITLAEGHIGAEVTQA